MSTLPDPKKLASKIIEHLGGLEEAKKSIDLEFGEVNRNWGQDIENIGRILRSHLFLEFYITQHLRETNPRLGNLDRSRLSFSQKVNLISADSQHINDVLPGIKHINKIRNRIAHNLSIDLESGDIEVFLSLQPFTALRNALADPNPPSSEPIDILEEFARYAASALTHEFSKFGSAFNKALKDAD